MENIKKKRIKILSKLFGHQIKQKIATENLDISERELLNKFSDYEITESGKYLEWMTKIYIGNGFLYEDLYKVKETLEIFHDNKIKLSKDKRDIQQYKTLAELWIEVKKFVEQKDDLLSTNEQKKKEKELVYSETEFLYEDDNLRLVAPLTENASKWWGKGTRWCTAAENNNMFLEYFKDAPLLIFDFKDGEKWQLWMNENSIQFMDEDDYAVSSEKIEKKWNLIENIFIKLLETNGLFIVKIPSLLKTQELCEIAVKQNGSNLQYVPYELRVKELCKIAVRQNGDNLKYIPFDIQMNEVSEIAIKQNGNNLRYIQNKYKTKELCELAVNTDIYAIMYVPLELITKELCEIVIKNDVFGYMYIPQKFLTKELYDLSKNRKTNITSKQYNKSEKKEMIDIKKVSDLDKYKEKFLEIKKDNEIENKC